MITEPPSPHQAIHATAFVVGEVGILVRGVSGAGKSLLAESAMHTARQNGLFAALVADDRVLLHPAGEGVVMRAHPAIIGLMERRGLGIISVPCLPAARLNAIVDLVPEGVDRLPEAYKQQARLLGFSFPCLSLASCQAMRVKGIFTYHDTTFWAWMLQIRQDAKGCR